LTARASLPVYIAVFLSHVGFGAATPLLPLIQRDFDVEAILIVLVMSVPAATRLVVDLPLGRLVDRITPAHMMIAGASITAGASLLTASAGDFPVLLFSRVGVGLGAAMVALSAMLALIRLNPQENRGRTLGAYQASLQAGSSVSPVLAGVVAAAFSWQAAFVCSALASFSAVGVLVFSTRAWQRRVDDDPSPSAHRDLREPAYPHAVGVDPPRSRVVLLNYVTLILFLSSSGVVMTALPLFAASELQLDAASIGLILGAATALRFVITLAGGELSDRIGPGLVLVPALALMSVALLLLPSVAGPLSLAGVTLMFSSGRLGNSVPIAALTAGARDRSLSRLLSTNRFVADLGSVLGPVLIGIAIVSVGYPPTFYSAAAVVASAGLASAVAVSRRG
jgi:predicted MFS family arabinose efflux permease